MTTLTVPKIASDNVFSRVFESPFSSNVKAVHDGLPLEQRVPLLLVRDLLRLGWRLQTSLKNSFELVPPDNYKKETIKNAMAFSRNDALRENDTWIRNHIDFARENLAKGIDVLESEILPRIEICNSQKQHDLFRLFRYYWSSPSSDYVGRRIRVLLRDDGIKGSPIIGIAALGSSIIHIPDRDSWIKWDTKTRSNRIIYMMDAYVIGAMPPYNNLLGGKLVSYALASDELRDIYKNKYENTKTIIKKRSANDLVLIVTSSLYGQNSSQYNRLKYGKSLLYKPIGITSGYGSLHISNDTFNAMLQLAIENKRNTSNRFGDGPNWRMRIIRSACDILDLNSDIILRHSFQRGLFAVALATNWRDFLLGKADIPKYRRLPLKNLSDFWRDRWLKMRKQNNSVTDLVKHFVPEHFVIEKSKVTDK